MKSMKVLLEILHRSQSAPSKASKHKDEFQEEKQLAKKYIFETLMVHPATAETFRVESTRG